MAVQQEILDEVDRRIAASDGVMLDLGRLDDMNPQTVKRAIRKIEEETKPGGRLPNLTRLYLMGNRIGDAGAREIAQRLTHLTTLSLGNSRHQRLFILG